MNTSPTFDDCSNMLVMAYSAFLKIGVHLILSEHKEAEEVALKAKQMIFDFIKQQDPLRKLHEENDE